jgi:hypothetical protein
MALITFSIAHNTLQSTPNLTQAPSYRSPLPCRLSPPAAPSPPHPLRCRPLSSSRAGPYPHQSSLQPNASLFLSPLRSWLTTATSSDPPPTSCPLPLPSSLSSPPRVAARWSLPPPPSANPIAVELSTASRWRRNWGPRLFYEEQRQQLSGGSGWIRIWLTSSSLSLPVPLYCVPVLAVPPRRHLHGLGYGGKIGFCL